MEGVAAGLGAMGFWLFIAAVVVAGIWGDARKRESQQETLRRLVESGQKVDAEAVEKLLAAGGNTKDLSRELTVAGLITTSVAPGLAIMGWFLAKINEDAMQPLLGAAFLTGFVGIGLLVAARVAKQWDRKDQI